MGKKSAKLYFKDDLFRFQTYISDAYEIGHHELIYRSGVLEDMPDVWDDHRGRGVDVGILGVVDRKHPDLKKNYKKSYLDRHDPMDDIEGSSSYGTFAAGIVAADDNGRGLVGVAPDAKVFSFTGDRRERPDILVMQGQTEAYGGPDDAGLLVDAKARDGLGRITIANSPADGKSYYRAESEYEGELVEGVTNSEFTIHSDRHVITTVGLGMYGFKATIPGGPVGGDMLLVGAPVGTSSYLQLGGYNVDPDDPAFDPPLYVPGGAFDPRSFDDIASTLGLDHSGKRGNNDSLGLWKLVAEAKLDVDPIKSNDYGVDFFGIGASAVVGGVAALMLDANPDLGWRDVQAILAYSANPVKVGKIPYFDEFVDWAVQEAPGQSWNGGGLMHSGEYGFGSLDAHAAVRLAETWGEAGEGPRTSKNEKVVTVEPVKGSELSLGVLNQSGDGSNGFVDTESGATIRFRLPKDIEIEHVALDISLDALAESSYGSRGKSADEVGLHLVAPGGQTSHLAGISSGGIYAPNHGGDSVDHTFTTRAYWGREAEAGEVWKLRVEASFLNEVEVDIKDVKLRFYGAPADRDDLYVYTDALVDMMTNGVHERYEELGDTIAEASGHGGRIRDGEGRDVLNASAMSYDLELHAGPGGRGRALDADGKRDVRLYDLAKGTAMDALISGDGDDRLVGWRGSDRLEGGRGRDRLEGRAGADRLEGGEGRDKLLGGGGSDRLRGGADDDRLVGGAGADRLWGDGGRDRLMGGGGADRLDGGSGRDRLAGGGGADRLDGGAGRDVLAGGGGADVFVLRRGGGRDLVRDFERGEDRVDVSGVAGRMRQLDLEQRGADAWIEARGVTLVLEDTRAHRLDADDFLF